MARSISMYISLLSWISDLETSNTEVARLKRGDDCFGRFIPCDVDFGETMGTIVTEQGNILSSTSGDGEFFFTDVGESNGGNVLEIDFFMLARIIIECIDDDGILGDGEDFFTEAEKSGFLYEKLCGGWGTSFARRSAGRFA